MTIMIQIMMFSFLQDGAPRCDVNVGLDSPHEYYSYLVRYIYHKP